MDENRFQENRNQGRDQSYGGGGRDRGRDRGRFRHGGGGGGGRNHHHGGGGRGRSQRPLLTSAINGAGLSLVALLIATANAGASPKILNHIQCLALATVFFGISSIVSYIAQRVKPQFVEWISDIFFLLAAVALIYIALDMGSML